MAAQSKPWTYVSEEGNDVSTVCADWFCSWAKRGNDSINSMEVFLVLIKH